MTNVRSIFVSRNPSDGKVPSTTAADYVEIPIRGASGGFQTTEIQSQIIRSTRQPQGSTRTGSSVGATIDSEAIYGAFDDIFEAALLSAGWAFVDGSAIKSASLTVAVDAGAKTITASAGTPFAGLNVGDWVRLEKATWENDGIVFHVASKTDTIITYDYASATVTTDASESGVIVRWGERVEIGTTEGVFTVVKKIGQTGTTIYELHTKSQFDGLTINAAIGSFMSLSFPYIGGSAIYDDTGTVTVDSNGDEAASGTAIAIGTYLTSGYTAAPSNTSFSPVKEASAMWVAGIQSTVLKNLTLTLGNNTQGEQVLFKAGNQFVAAGDAVVSGTFNAIFDAPDIMQSVVADDAVAVQFYLVDDQGQGYIFDCPNCKLGSNGTPISNGRDLVQQQLRFSAAPDPTTGRSFSITRLSIA